MIAERRIEELQQQSARLSLAQGKAWFVRRHMAFTVVFFAVVLGVPLLWHGVTRSDEIALAIMAPVCLLAGYLEAIWQWKDLVKKYGE